MIKLIMAFAAMAAFATSLAAQELPTEYTVEMWNKDPADKTRKMVFSEEIIRVAPGATVTWLATDKGHNVEFVDGPDGVDLAPKSKVGVDATVTLTEPGMYVYVCSPHASMGMIGIVVVGEATPEAIAMIADAKMNGQSKKKFDALLGELAQ